MTTSGGGAVAEALGRSSQLPHPTPVRLAALYCGLARSQSAVRVHLVRPTRKETTSLSELATDVIQPPSFT